MREISPDRARMGRRIANVDGRRIGILVNDRPGAEALARGAAREYEERHRGRITVFQSKGRPGEPCPVDTLAALAESCDFLITAAGDTEASVQRVVNDGIDFEQLGKPALTLCTKAFREAALAAATSRGLPRYPFICVDHPLLVSDREGFSERVLYAYRQGMATLTGVYVMIG